MPSVINKFSPSTFQKCDRHLTKLCNRIKKEKRNHIKIETRKTKSNSMYSSYSDAKQASKQKKQKN